MHQIFSKLHICRTVLGCPMQCIQGVIMLHGTSLQSLLYPLSIWILPGAKREQVIKSEAATIASLYIQDMPGMVCLPQHFAPGLLAYKTEIIYHLFIPWNKI